MPEAYGQETPGTAARFIRTCDDIRHSLEYLAGIGCRGFDCCPGTVRLMDAWGTGSPGRAETLESIRSELGNCRRCKLAETRNHIVFGAGNPDAGLLFVGEGPGYDEDLQGLPFVGAAGQLLTKIIQAIQLRREQVYICNVVKCRPPGNRNPLPDEIGACVPFLKRQIQSIRPAMICALGAFAAQTLLETTEPISSLRGRIFDYMGIKLLATYHPAYLLRNPDQKKAVWEDMKTLMREMG
ncbi:MAG: uracil-DNA glycosylase [Desulfobacterales bacterium]|nr:uracil-DNA glycosylase [Desulfobacterales bacterium]